MLDSSSLVNKQVVVTLKIQKSCSTDVAFSHYQYVHNSHSKDKVKSQYRYSIVTVQIKQSHSTDKEEIQCSHSAYTVYYTARVRLYRFLSPCIYSILYSHPISSLRPPLLRRGGRQSSYIAPTSRPGYIILYLHSIDKVKIKYSHSTDTV